jgi:precorrin-6B methylase 2
LDRLGVRVDDVVIDFGCGPGFYTIPLAGLAGRVIAIDSQTGMLEKASKYAAKKGFEFIVDH